VDVGWKHGLDEKPFSGGAIRQYRSAAGSVRAARSASILHFVRRYTLIFCSTVDSSREKVTGQRAEILGRLAQVAA